MKFTLFLLLVLFATSILADRGMSTDRPGKGDSPNSVSKGRFQFETDLINQTRQDNEETEVKTTIFNGINLKYGISENTDVQVIIPSYVEKKIKNQGNEEKKMGLGDTLLRYKINIFGNDDTTAMGLLPFIKLPTAGAGLSNRFVEYGAALPLSVTFLNDWNFGTQIQVDHLRRSDDMGWQTDYVLVSTLGRRIVGDLSGFIELFSRTSDNSQQGAISTFDLGLTYQVTPQILLDTGAYFGLTEAAEELQTFLGLSVLF